jgi:hypothetical protein
MAEHHLAVLLVKVLIQPQARTGLGQDGDERGLAHLKRLTAQVVTTQLDKVEGVQEDAGVVPRSTARMSSPSFTQRSASAACR